MVSFSSPKDFLFLIEYNDTKNTRFLTFTHFLGLLLEIDAEYQSHPLSKGVLMVGIAMTFLPV